MNQHVLGRLSAAGLLVIWPYLANVGLAAAQENQQNAAARNLATLGAEAFQNGDCDQALTQFEMALSLHRAPTLTFWRARALECLGRLLEAEAAYKEVARTSLNRKSPRAFQKAVEDSEAALSKVRDRIPTLRVCVNNAEGEFSVWLNGTTLPRDALDVQRPVDPGRYSIELRRGSETLSRSSFVLSEGQQQELMLGVGSVASTGCDTRAVKFKSLLEDSGPLETSTSRTAEGPNTQQVLGWVALGTGVAAIAGGVALDIQARNERDNLETTCPGNVCPQSARDDVDSYRTARNLSVASLAVGAGLAGLGTYLVWSSSDDEEASELRVSTSGSRLWVSGSF